MTRVVHIAVPFYETLKLEHIFSFFLENKLVIPYMPDDKELRKLPRQWICNVGASIIGKPFQNWVTERIKARNEGAVEKKNMLIAMDPAVAAAFHASTAVSRKCLIRFSVSVVWRSIRRSSMSIAKLTKFLVQNGAGFNMLKSGSKRRRTTKEVQFEREQSKMKTADFEQQLADLKNFEL